MSTVELHTERHIDNLDKPDRFVLDLDPDPALPWTRMVEATQLTLSVLDELGLKAFLKPAEARAFTWWCH
jgi:bifunctional non-homologous end joining protein LigD